MRYAPGTLADVTAALNDTITELGAPISPADGTLTSATAQLNALLVWSGSSIDPADGTLTDVADTYNQLVTEFTLFRYQLNGAPPASNDGSGVVRHDIEAQYSLDIGDTWLTVPNHHKTICIPYAQVKTVMDMSNNDKPAKNLAYKVLLVTYRNYQPVPLAQPSASDWSLSGLGSYMAAYAAWLAVFNAINAAVVTEADRVNTYITATLGQSYPLPFSL
ncbi:MAG: hypothetical protein ACXABY_15295 [Candidatus Thorarchaeota archaeon]|jgi:hypothetical protein